MTANAASGEAAETRPTQAEAAGRTSGGDGGDAGSAAPVAGDESATAQAETDDEPEPSGEAASAVEAKEDEAEFLISGVLSISYRARTRGDDNDEDLYGYLSLSGGDPATNDVTFHLYGRSTFDIDGDEERPSEFFSLNDVFGDRLDLKLYEAFVELRRSLVPDSLGVERIRLGRQSVHAGYTYLVDGARVDFETIEEAGNLRIGIYGGVPEFLYESSRSGDWLAGADVTFNPFDTTRVDLRYVHAEESNDFNGRGLEDDYLALAVRQAVGDELTLAAEWNTLDFATRDVRFSLAWDLAECDFSLRFSYRYQNDIRREFTTPFDPFTAVLGDSFAHHQAQLQVSKLFGEHVGLDAGVTGRLLHDRSDAPFNREFVRAWLTLSTYKWPADELELALTGEFWSAGRDEVVTAGGEITWRPIDTVRVSAGTYYSLFKYDLFVLEEREDATTLFLRGRWEFVEDVRLDGRYEFETGDEGDFHTVWVGLSWSF